MTSEVEVIDLTSDEPEVIDLTSDEPEIIDLTRGDFESDIDEGEPEVIYIVNDDDSDSDELTTTETADYDSDGPRWVDDIEGNPYLPRYVTDEIGYGTFAQYVNNLYRLGFPPANQDEMDDLFYNFVDMMTDVHNEYEPGRR